MKLGIMTLRTLPSAFVTLAFAAVAGVAGIAPAHAASDAYGQIQLAVTHHGPIFTDNNGLGYDIVVTNNGPDTATHVVLRTTGWACEANAQNTDTCKQIADRFDPTKPMDFTTDLGGRHARRVLGGHHHPGREPGLHPDHDRGGQQRPVRHRLGARDL
jgi:hypothetical protein